MSDVRALLAGRNLRVNDGAYLERADKPPPVLEEMLRSAQARLAFLVPERSQGLSGANTGSGSGDASAG